MVKFIPGSTNAKDWMYIWRSAGVLLLCSLGSKATEKGVGDEVGLSDQSCDSLQAHAFCRYHQYLHCNLTHKIPHSAWPGRKYTLDLTNRALTKLHGLIACDCLHRSLVGPGPLRNTSTIFSCRSIQNHILGAVPPDPVRQRELAEDHGSPSSLPTWASCSWRALTGLVYQSSP